MCMVSDIKIEKECIIEISNILKEFNDFSIISPTYVNENIHKLNIPTIVLHGKNDKIVPISGCNEISKLEKFWSDLGSKVKLMSFDQHDYVLSLTSHLPHAVAYSIVKTAINDDDKFKNDIIQYSAGGLRDFTRIAASDPLMWRDIFIDNSENILKVLNDYSKNLDEIKTAIKNKDGEKLIKIFSSTSRKTRVYHTLKRVSKRFGTRPGIKIKRFQLLNSRLKNRAVAAIKNGPACQVP